jgi:AP-2 complex subunit beta-1
MDAEQLAERISIRLQHANSAVVLTTIKVLLYLMNYMEDESLLRALERKMGPPLGTCVSVPFACLSLITLDVQLRSCPLDLKYNTSVSEISC